MAPGEEKVPLRRAFGRGVECEKGALVQAKRLIWRGRKGTLEEEEKGEERKEGGKSLFLQGALYTFYVHSTILKISTPAAGRQLGFFLASLEKNRPGGSDFFFPALRQRAMATATDSNLLPASGKKKTPSALAMASVFLGPPPL